MKIKIIKRNVPSYSVVSAFESEGMKVVLAPSLVREIMKFQDIMQDVQKLLCAFYEGRFTPEGQIKSILERVNDSHNRRPD